MENVKIVAGLLPSGLCSNVNTVSAGNLSAKTVDFDVKSAATNLVPFAFVIPTPE